MKYYSQYRCHDLFELQQSLSGLSKENRWVKLADSLPWDKIEKEYNKRLNNAHNGAGNKPARMVVGAMIVKHVECLSDEKTIQAIQENPYMQYLLGLNAFTENPVFVPELFVDFQDMGGVKGGRQYTVSVARWQADGDNVSIESFKKGVGRPGKFEFSDVPKGYPMLAMTLAPTPDCEQQTYASVKCNVGKIVFLFCKSDSVAQVAEEIINSPGYEALKQFIEGYTPDEQTATSPSSQAAETAQGDDDFDAFFKKFASDLKFQPKTGFSARTWPCLRRGVPCWAA